MDLGLQGVNVTAIPDSLRDAVGRRWREGRPGPTLVRVALRLRLPDAQAEAVRQIADPQVAPGERASLVRALGEAGDNKSIDTLLPLVAAVQPKDVRLAALAALGRFDDPRVALAVLQSYAAMPADLRASAASLLVGRPSSARALVDAVDAGRVAPDLVPPDAARRMLLHHDPRLDGAVGKYWASARPASEQEKAAATARVRQVLANGLRSGRVRSRMSSAGGRCS